MCMSLFLTENPIDVPNFVPIFDVGTYVINWKEKLATPLGLSAAEIHDINFSNQNQPILQQ